MRLAQKIRCEFFNLMYIGVPPWDIGRPQREIVRLAEGGEVRGDVLDVGCGAGDNALYLASRGHEVWGIDISPRAIKKAKAKAKQHGLKVTFLVHDALELESLGRTFDTLIDSGLFHVFTDEERLVFTRSLRGVLRPGGTYFMLCFSEHEPDYGGPRRVTQAEIRATFSEGWKINYIREARLESNVHADGAMAWLSSITRM